MKTLLAVVLLAVTVSARDVSAPDLDPDLADSWKLNVQLAEKAVAKDEATLKKTPEYKAFEESTRILEQVRRGVQSSATKRYPGFTLDLKTWELVPQQAKK